LIRLGSGVLLNLLVAPPFTVAAYGRLLKAAPDL
jgi:hypothetical protein